ncbi:hypothetical protein [Maridesulfovibrio salexigens]|uniref:PH domain-containing protein n=1 Tax=Maridesulfovibrio salexigens (strain ATCC 14822 / DSM 2638 / NCIMB 8403 / VKM B-1763) TaxID=526222 RepID=C6BS09_MARSD|nr:hypothetical protein [Maridesulfovibrio salexigens]ACS81392.1 hypothetical protein Desal_3342 [Maridesulfovibrio salexigens DSM 2638]
MPEEIILRNDMRPVGIALCGFGLFGTIGFLLFSIFGSYPAQSNGEIYLARILATLGIIAFLWKMITLNAQKYFLETSDDGIRINGTVTKYIPWENIKDIFIEQPTPEPQEDDEDYSPFMKPRLAPIMYLQIHNAEKIFFESKVYKFSPRKVDNYIEKLAALDNRIPLDMELMTANTQEEICEMLRTRWEIAVGE